ncbi:MAG: replication-associated recombination protein A [Lactobacillaceae bacterium]|jgi:putative ATPase|nr:replication-associated recombination protein A [Lactobacillaceae bacterium]
MEETLFSSQIKRPLADRLRPKSLSEVVGQDQVVGPDAPLGRMVKSGKITSFILWGPPGCGKTTIARLIAEDTNLYFEQISAVFSGVADLKRVFQYAEERRASQGKGTLLFVDEIHRFNKSQQDGFLPYVENGTIILVGATTENPSFELNAALLSRAQVFVLNRLTYDDFETLLQRAEKEMGRKLPVDDDARGFMKEIADGDGRYILNLAENIFSYAQDNEVFDKDAVIKLVRSRAPIYDKGRDGHYNLISAVHKSMRGSDPDATMYWVARMIESGEDPRYLLRRLTRFAVEDVSLADPNAVTQAVACWEIYERLGSPEGDLAVFQLAVYLATAPKSVGIYKASYKAKDLARRTGSLMPPKNILNAPTKLMRNLGYGEGYQYDPDEEDGFSGANYFPTEMKREKIYHPADRGFEREIKKRVDYFDNLRREKQKNTKKED